METNQQKENQAKAAEAMSKPKSVLEKRWMCFKPSTGRVYSMFVLLGN